MDNKDKYFQIDDDDVKITYERRKSSSTDEIHGFNPVIIFTIIIISLFCAVTIGNQSNNNQQTPVIINNN